MKIYLLGSGGALTTERRAHTSIAVEADDQTLLIECSGTPMHSLRRAGLDWTGLTDIVLTHRHPDHLYGLPSLALHIYVECLQLRRNHSLRIFGPEDALDVAKAILDTVDLSGRDELQLEYLPLPRGEHGTTIGDLEVSTFPVDHGDIVALGVEITQRSWKGGTLLFSGDTSPCDSLIERSQGAGLVLHECSSIEGPLEGHTSLAQMVEVARRTTAERIILVHLPPLTPQEEGVVRRGLRADFGGRVQLGEDGMSWDI